MIAEILPGLYDATGKQVSQPFHVRKLPRPTFPMGRYVSQPLTIQCKTMEDLRNFLSTCRAVSDEDLFGKRDYWQPPDQFEKLKAGDCEDFSFWTWRQLLAMGFDARIVFGRHGRYGVGHAWVEFFHNSKCYLLEPQACHLGLTLPRLSVLRYKPKFSVTWDGKVMRYYAHKSETPADFNLVLMLIPEWIAIWGSFWLKVGPRLPYWIGRRLWRKLGAKKPAPASTDV